MPIIYRVPRRDSLSEPTGAMEDPSSRRALAATTQCGAQAVRHPRRECHAYVVSRPTLLRPLINAFHPHRRACAVLDLMLLLQRCPCLSRLWSPCPLLLCTLCHSVVLGYWQPTAMCHWCSDRVYYEQPGSSAAVRGNVFAHVHLTERGPSHRGLFEWATTVCGGTSILH